MNDCLKHSEAHKGSTKLWPLECRVLIPTSYTEIIGSDGWWKKIEVNLVKGTLIEYTLWWVTLTSKSSIETSGCKFETVIRYPCIGLRDATAETDCATGASVPLRTDCKNQTTQPTNQVKEMQVQCVSSGLKQSCYVNNFNCFKHYQIKWLEPWEIFIGTTQK